MKVKKMNNLTLMKIGNFIFLCAVIGCVIWMRFDYQNKLNQQVEYFDEQIKAVNVAITNSEGEYALLYKQTTDNLIRIGEKLDQLNILIKK